MIKKYHAIRFADEPLHLLPDRALFWPAESALIVADLHLGKAAGFRAHGIPVPSGSTAKDLDRLNALIWATQCKRLLILGDFYHSRRGIDERLIESITKWRKSVSSLSIQLIRGNHDRSSGRAEPEWNFEEVDDSIDLPPFTLAHFDTHAGTYPLLCGHVHPVVSVRDFDGSAVRAPCFVVDDRKLILPSFGSFTGGFSIRAQPNRQIFLATRTAVVPFRAP
jgi:DNA ligase-associated metallophosphoesterase